MLISLALLPVLGLESYSEYDARQIRQQLVEDEALRLVGLVAAEQQRIVEGAEQVLDTLASTPAVQENDSDRCSRLIVALLNKAPRYNDVSVLALDGHLLCTPRPNPSINGSDRDYFRDALRSRGFAVGTYTVGRTSGQPTIHFAKPFTNKDGVISGVIEVGLNLRWVSEQLNDLPIPRATGITITDRNGILLARYPEANDVGQPTFDRNLRILQGNKVEVYHTTNRVGRAVITGYSPPGAEPKGMAVAVWLDQATAFAGVTRANQLGLLLILTGGALAILITVLLGARLIRRPFNQLLAVAEQWGSGDLAVRSGIAADQSEFGRLGRAFDAMAEKLATRERSLQESEALLRAVLEQIPAGVSILKRPDGQVAVRSHYTETLLGLPSDREAQPEQKWTDRRGEHADGTPYKPEEYPSWRALYRNETIIGEPLLYRRPDGRLVELEVYSAPVRDAQGKTVAAVAVSVDVGERNEARRVLARSNAELEARVAEEVSAREAMQTQVAHVERMQALGQLAGGIAHDFNNLLQTIEGAAALIQRRPKDETTVLKMTRLAREAVDRGASITRRLLTFGRRSNLTDELVDVAAMLAGMEEVFLHTLGRAVEVEVRVAEGLPAVLADKGQLETALVNLATNARDAMADGGRLTLSAEREIVPAEQRVHPLNLAPGAYVRFTITDTGAGMDAETLKHATEPFFTTKGLGKGTGLGLPMVYGFVEQSGGAMNIASTPGKGTTVTLWLPVAKTAAPPTAPEDTDRAAAASATARVLLVDDEDLLRDVLAEQLEDAGYHAVVAGSGSEALALLAAGEGVDALVTDFAMPGMDGLALIRAAHEVRPDLPAVLLSGYAGEDPEIAVARRASDEFSMLRKPVRLDELIGRLGSLLAK